MNVSLICACKNRIDSLRLALSSWLSKKEITEIIIVDWNSDESISFLSEIDSRISIVTVPNQKYFNLAQPLNLAASLATGDYILKVDCDYILNPYDNFFERYKIDENTFLSGNLNAKNYEYFDGENYVIDKNNMSLYELVEYVNTYSPIFKYLSGLLFVSRENFEKVGGYNENYRKYYGYEDGEMVHRLKLLGLEETKINFDYSILHLPHSNIDRIKNHEGYTSEDLEKIKNTLYGQSEEEKQWNAEYLLVMEHTEKSKNQIHLPDTYHINQLTKWNIRKVDNQNYCAFEVMKKNPLENFPSVYYISLEESVDRRQALEKQFAEYGIIPKPVISKRFSESDDQITGEFIQSLNSGTAGCVASHLKMIRKWYEETDEDYGFFCEDDLSLETLGYWDFTWEEFIGKIPEDAHAVQLLIIRKNFETFELRRRLWDDWSGTAYILTREYAKILINRYCLDENRFHLEIIEDGNHISPLLENVLFETIKNISYSAPLFIENTEFKSTFSPEEDAEVVNDQKRGHYEARELVFNYWKGKSKSFKIRKTEEKKVNSEMNQIETLLTRYSEDPENAESNFNLGIWYWNHDHTAPASSFLLRCAERAEDSLLAYEALLFAHLCYEKQGTRDWTAKTFLQHAMCLLPNRPEAYYLIARFYNKRQHWQDTYVAIEQGLNLMRGNSIPLKSLRENVGYPGEHALLYEKAISAWWWGKVDETRQILKKIKNNLTEQDFINLEQLGIKNIQIADDEEVKPKKLNFKKKLKTDGLKFDLIIQGKYYDYTDKLVECYSNLPFVNNVIVSCWEDDNVNSTIIKENCKLIRSQYPVSPGNGNENLQIVSSLNGLKESTSEFSIKIRSDQLYTVESMMEMYNFFVEHLQKELSYHYDYEKPKGKIFVVGVHPDLLFHIRDHMYWGYTDDLIDLFDIPLEKNSVLEVINLPNSRDLGHYFDCFIRVESYIGAHYCARFQPLINRMLLKPSDYLHDGASNWNQAKEISNELVPKVFKSFPRSIIDFDWLGKTEWNIPGIPWSVQPYLDHTCWHENGY